MVALQVEPLLASLLLLLLELKDAADAAADKGRHLTQGEVRILWRRRLVENHHHALGLDERDPGDVEVVEALALLDARVGLGDEVCHQLVEGGVANYMRRHGPFEPHRLPADEMEYTSLPGVLEKLEGRFEDM